MKSLVQKSMHPPLSLSLSLSCSPSFIKTSNAFPDPIKKTNHQCEDISKLLPSEDACAFAKLNCDTGSLIPYPELYYCLAKPAGFPAAALATLLTSVVLVALFRALSATAEDYFTPAMTQASAAVRMPPRLAGATLLALGNGAPDIGAAVAATRSGALELAAGALLGSGLFIGCVVAGAVVRAAGGVPARGALLRDVCGYGIAVLGAVLVLSRGGGRGGGGAGGGEAAAATTAGAGSAAFLLLLYLCYVLAVAGADAAKIIKDAQGYDDDDEIESGGGGRASSAPLLAPASAFWAPPEADLPLSAAPAPALLHQATAHPNNHHHRLPLAPQHVAAAAEELEMTLSDMSMTPMAGGGRGGRGGGGEGREGGSSPPRSERTTVSDGRASSSGVGVGGDFSNDDEQAEESNKRVHDDSSSSSRTLASATASSHDQLQPRGDLFAASGSPPVAPDTGPSAGTSLGRRRARPRALTLFGGGGGGGEAGPAAAAGAGPPPLSSRLLACLRVLDAPLTVSRAMTIPVLPGGGGGGGGGEGGEGGGGGGEGGGGGGGGRACGRLRVAARGPAARAARRRAEAEPLVPLAEPAEVRGLSEPGRLRRRRRLGGVPGGSREEQRQRRRRTRGERSRRRRGGGELPSLAAAPLRPAAARRRDLPQDPQALLRCRPRLLPAGSRPLGRLPGLRARRGRHARRRRLWRPPGSGRRHPAGVGQLRRGPGDERRHRQEGVTQHGPDGLLRLPARQSAAGLGGRDRGRCCERLPRALAPRRGPGRSRRGRGMGLGDGAGGARCSLPRQEEAPFGLLVGSAGGVRVLCRERARVGGSCWRRNGLKGEEEREQKRTNEKKNIFVANTLSSFFPLENPV